MEKKQKQILIGVAVLLLLYYLLRKDSSSVSDDKSGSASEEGDDGFGGGGGSNASYQPTGDDSSDSQSQDPTSPILDYKPISRKPSVPLVGDITSGSSGKPSLGKPSQSNVSYRRPWGTGGLASQQRILRGYPQPSGGGSYFK